MKCRQLGESEVEFPGKEVLRKGTIREFQPEEGLGARKGRFVSSYTGNEWRIERMIYYSKYSHP